MTFAFKNTQIIIQGEVKMGIIFRHFKDKKALFILASMMALTLTFCGGGNASPQTSGSPSVLATEDKNELITIKYPTLLFSDPVYIADAKGFFAEEGLKVEFTGVLPPANIIASVANGSNDFGGTHASYILRAIAAEFPVKAVAAGWASTKDNPSSAIIVAKDSPYQTISDLRGVKFAGQPGGYITSEGLALGGLTEEDITFVTLDFDKIEVAIANGSVAAGEVLNPYLTKALKTGNFRILYDITDVFGEEKGWPQQFTSTKLIEEKPELVKKFVSAIAKANNWARRNPKEAGEIFANAFEAPPEYAEYYVAEYPENAVIDEANAQLYLDLLKKYNEGDVKAEDFYTNEFNENYKK
jgi:ABC-type nitrate/sulfonate/bicarbonate transport system substrate-binding protein